MPSLRRLVLSRQTQSDLRVPAQDCQLTLVIGTVVTVNTPTTHYNKTMFG